METKSADYLVRAEDILKEFRRQRGNRKPAFLGVGQSGCVLSPGMPCPGASAPNGEDASAMRTVSKMMRYAGAFDAEMENNARVHMLDPDHQFTVRMIGRPCVQWISSLQDCVNKECSTIVGQHDPDTKDVYLQITYEYGGEDIATKISGGKWMYGFYYLWQAAQSIFKGLVTMSSGHNVIVHNDIKPANILFQHTDRKGRLLLVDWGEATFELSAEVASGDRNYMPPEEDRSQAAHRRVQGMLKDLDAKFLQWRDRLHLSLDYPDQFLKRVMAENDAFSKAGRKKIDRDGRSTRDVYSWGVTLLEMFHTDMLINNGFDKFLVRMTRPDKTHSPEDIFRWLVGVIGVITKMVRSDPTHRPDAGGALSLYTGYRCISCVRGLAKQ